MNNKTNSRPALAPPSRSGEVLIVPNLTQAIGDLRANRERFAAEQTAIMTGRLNEHRLRIRRELLGRADRYCRRLGLAQLEALPEQPLIVTGHQSQFYHCGVFAKIILAHLLGQRCGGAVLNLILDNDLPKQLDLKIPLKEGDTIRLVRLELAPFEAHLPLECQAQVTPEQLKLFVRQLRELPVSTVLRDSLALLGDIMEEIYSLSRHPAELYALLNHRLAQRLGLQYLELSVSALAESAGFMLFTADLLNRAHLARDCYNKALADFRRRHHIRGKNQPMPELAGHCEQDGQVETPFWLVHPSRGRMRLFVRRAGDKLFFGETDTQLGELAIDSLSEPDRAETALRRAMCSADVKLRPRALALTIFARLFVGDTFIHGIGGARYDEVADRFITLFYGVEPPSYICCSATMRLTGFGISEPDRVLSQLRRLRHQQRDIRLNPQRYLCDPNARSGTPDESYPGEVARLLEQRADAVETGRQLRRDHAPGPERRGVFEKIRQLNTRILDTRPDLAAGLATRLQQNEQLLHQARLAHDREYYFGLFSQDQLQKLKTQCGRELS